MAEATHKIDSPSRLAAAASGLWTALVTLAVVMVLAGLVWPGGDDAAEVPPGAPQRLELPGLKTKAKVVPIRLRGEVLDPPRNPREIGWWVGSAKPGSAQGQTVVTGHTVHTGGGSLNKLDHIEPGQEVDIATKDGTFQHQVDSVQVLSRSELRMRVWERGAGITLACGTGTCATVLAGALSGRCGRTASVH